MLLNKKSGYHFFCTSILSIGIFFGLYDHTFAFTLSPEYGGVDAGVVSTASDYSPAGELFVFRVDTGAWVSNTFDSNITIGGIDWDGSTDFWIVPVNPDSNGWGACSFTFNDCIADPDHYVSSVGYQLLHYGFPPNNLSDTSNNATFTQYPPSVVINSALAQKTLSGTTTISYQATDQNDNGYDIEKTQYGLPKNPVSLFYSDKIADWYGAPVPDPFKSLIVAGQPASGNYLWTTARLTPGVFYRIVADATDRGGLLGEGLSGLFTVDFTPPSFAVKADPAAIRSGTVNITVDASEDLPSAPQATVAQNGAPAVPLPLSGSGSHFTGSYTVRSGYDGTAVISVSAADAAGNIGTVITSGGTFSVGQNPPPKPTITSPAKGVGAPGDSVDIKGNTRNDTTLVLRSNGVDIATSAPLADGSFSFKNIPLEKSKNQGKNIFSISAVDAFGVASEPDVVEIKRNIPPIVAISRPQNGAVASDQSEIVLNASDENGDTLVFTYEEAPALSSAANPKESDWSIISDSVPSSGFVWDTTALNDGAYMLRALAYDGTVTSTSTPARVVVKNTLPFLRFDDGRQTYSKDPNVVVSGHAMEPASLSVTPTIATIEYSLDGKKWTFVPFSGDAGTNVGNRFSVSLADLKEGTYPMLWRVKDSRGLFGKTTHIVVVDKTSPKAPIIESPQNGAVLSRDDDTNQGRPGLQMAISGLAEPGSALSLIYDSQIAASKALPNGRFSFSDITLAARGKHQIAVSATDAAGNKSLSSALTLIYDDPPAMEFTNPKPFGGIKGIAAVSWKIKDLDSSLTRDTSIAYRRAGGSWKTLVLHANKVGSTTLDASNLPEANDYELRILSDDGLVPASFIESFSVDKTPPSLAGATIDLRKPSDNSIVLAQGRATDAVSGVDSVEYSLHNIATAEQSPWYEGLITNGHLGKNASFQIKYPGALADGAYTISLRAVDAAGNVSNQINLPFSLDATAPRVGSFFAESSGIFISPDELGILTIPEGSPATFGMSLESDTMKASLSLGGTSVALKKNIASGLWEAPVSLALATTSPIVVSAADSHGNKISGRTIGFLRAVARGHISYMEKGEENPLGGASIRVLKLNDDTGSWTAQSPATSDAKGQYGLALGRGTYRIFVTKAGWKTVEKGLTLADPGFVTLPFATYRISGFAAWWQSIVDRFRY